MRRASTRTNDASKSAENLGLLVAAIQSESAQLERLNQFVQPRAETIVGEDAVLRDCRRQLLHCLHSRAVNIMVIVLAVIDALLLVAVLQLEIEALKLGHGPVHQRIETARFTLECISLTIVSVFCVELLLKFFAAGPREFCSQWVEVVDLLVTLISLGIDSYLVGLAILLKEGDGHQSESSMVAHSLVPATGLVILFRLWRIIRIVNATLVSITTGIQSKVERLEESRMGLMKRVRLLERLLRRNNIPVPRK